MPPDERVEGIQIFVKQFFDYHLWADNPEKIYEHIERDSSLNEKERKDDTFNSN